MRPIIAIALYLCALAVAGATLVIVMPQNCTPLIVKAADGKNYLGCKGDPNLPRPAK